MCMNYYERLGVTPDSDVAEIKAAYRKLARKFHPDINPDGVKIFNEISEAYDTLIDEEKRKRYNVVHGIFKSTKSNEKNEKDTDVKKDTNTETKDKKSTKRKAKTHDFSKMFESFFESSQKSEHQPIDGDDINADVSISVVEALKGTTKTVNVMHTELCPRCRGRKFINGSKCNVCNGSGEYSNHKRISVKIPKGIKNGSKLRLKNEGGSGLFGGKNGDLFLNIIIEQNKKVKYEGLNIVYTVPITPYEAVLGAEILIPTVEGSVKLKLPERTTSGQKFRISGQGLSKNGKTGDIIVTVSIEIPKVLSDDEVKLYEKLKKLSSNNIRENLLDG